MSNGEIETKHWKIKTCSYDSIENLEVRDDAKKNKLYDADRKKRRLR